MSATATATTVRAKMRVTENRPEYDHEDATRRIKLFAVYSGSEENKAFWQATPSGYLEFSVVNPSTAAFFEQGVEYYVDFTKAEAGGS